MQPKKTLARAPYVLTSLPRGTYLAPHSAPFSKGAIQETKQMMLFCEDPRLSFPQEGEEFFALVIDRDTTPTLNQTELQTVIDFCAAFIDCESLHAEVKAKYGPKARQRSYMTQLWTNGEAMLQRLDPRLSKI